MVDLPIPRRRLVTPEAPTDKVSARTIAASGAALGKSLAGLGSALEAVGKPLAVEAGTEAGQKAVSRDEQGKIQIETPDSNVILGGMGYAYQAAVEAQLKVGIRSKLDEDLTEMRNKFRGNPDGFRQNAAEYIKTLAGQYADNDIGQIVQAYGTRIVTQHYTAEVNQKAARDIQQSAMVMDQRQKNLIGQLESLTMRGLTGSDEFKRVNNELKALLDAQEANPLFKMNPELRKLTEENIQRRLSAMAIVSDAKNAFRTTGNQQYAVQNLEEKLRQLGLPEADVQRYRRLATSGVASAASMRRARAKELRTQAAGMIESIQAQPGLVFSDDEVNNVASQMLAVGDAKGAAQLVAAQRSQELKAQIMYGGPETRKAAQLEAERIKAQGVTIATGGANFNVSAAQQAIANIESAGGNYSARGPVVTKGSYKGDRAYGKYQVMGRNIPSWTREALGRELTVAQFLADPTAQDRVFNHFFGKAVKKYGSVADAASVWFTGQPASKAAGKSDGYTSAPDYIRRFTADYAKLSGGQAPAAGGKTGTVRLQGRDYMKQFAGEIEAANLGVYQELVTPLIKSMREGVTPDPDQYRAVQELVPFLPKSKTAELRKAWVEAHKIMQSKQAQTRPTNIGGVDPGEAVTRLFDERLKDGGVSPALKAAADGWTKTREKVLERDQTYPLNNGLNIMGGENSDDFGAFVPIDWNNPASVEQGLSLRKFQLGSYKEFTPDAGDMPLYEQDIAGLVSAIRSGDGASTRALLDTIAKNVDGPGMAAIFGNKEVKNALLKARFDPQKFRSVYNFLNAVEDKTGAQFDDLVPSDVRRDLSLFSTYEATMGDEDLLKRLNENLSPAQEKTFDERRKQAEKDLKNVDPSTVARQVAERWRVADFAQWRTNAPLSFPDQAANQGMLFAYKEAYKDQFSRTGDKNVAHEHAMKHLKKVYGPSATSGGRVMRYPPERFAPEVNGSKDWVKDHVLQNIMEAHGLTGDQLKTKPGDLPGLAGPLAAPAQILSAIAGRATSNLTPKQQRGLKLLQGEVVLRADEVTRSDLSSQKTPSYQVWVRTPEGTLELLTDPDRPGEPFRYSWTPDEIEAMRKPGYDWFNKNRGTIQQRRRIEQQQREGIRNLMSPLSGDGEGE